MRNSLILPISLLLATSCAFEFGRGLELEPGDVAGRVVDESGAALPFARVEVVGTSQLQHASSDGAFHLRDLPAGRWSVRFTVDDDGDGLPERAARRSFAITVIAHASGPFSDDEPRRTSLLLGDVTVGPAVEVRGRVVRDSIPWAGALVVAAGVDDDRVLADAFHTSTDDEGDYRLVLPAAAFGLTAYATTQVDDLVSQTITIDPNPGTLIGPGGGQGIVALALSPVDPLRQVELRFAPEGSGTLTVSGRRLLPVAETIDDAPIDASSSPGALELPTGTIDLVVRDAEGQTATLFSQSIPSESPVVIGAIDLSRPTCAPGGDDCDGDGLPSLPDPTVPANGLTYASCAGACSRAWGTGNVGASCEVEGTTFDCDDDGDGTPEPYEPRDCVGMGLGADADSDGTCDTRDPFPRCAVDDPFALSCEANAPFPPQPGPWPGWTQPFVPDAGPQDAGSDGGVDAGSDGGLDAGADGGSDAGADGGSDAGTDGGPDAGVDGGLDAGADGGLDGGADAGADDAGLDAGTDAGLDAGVPLDGGMCAPPIALAIPTDLSFASIPVERSYIYDLAVSPDQYVYVVGQTGGAEDSVTLGHPGRQCAPSYSVPGSAFIASFDPTGGCSWARVLDGYTGVWRLDVGKNGDVVMSADFVTSFDQFGVSLTSPSTAGTAGLVRFAPDGTARDGLALPAQANASTSVSDVLVLDDGAVAVLGYITGPTTFGAGETNETTLLGPGGSPRESFLAVFECDLSLRSVASLGTGPRLAALTSADLGDPRGPHFFVGGRGTMNMFVGTPAELHSTTDGVLLATDPLGTPLWAALQIGISEVIEVAVNPSATQVAVVGRGAPVDVYAPGVSSLDFDGGLAGPAALTLLEPTGSGGATAVLYDPTNGTPLGGAVVSGDFVFANGAAFIDDNTLGMAGNTFDFAQGPVAGADAGVRHDLAEPQGGYAITIDVTDPAAPDTISLRVVDTNIDLWVEEGAVDVFADGSLVLGGYMSHTGRHDGVAGLFSGETDRAWLWRSRDGDEAFGPEINDAGPCGPTGNPLAGDVLVQVISDPAEFEARFSRSLDGEFIDFSSVAVPPDAGPVSFVEDEFLSAGLRMIVPGGRYAHPDFSMPNAYATSGVGGNRYAPGPVVGGDAGAPAGANLTELRFEAPGCATAATSGFGALFVDSTITDQSRIRVYDGADALIADEAITTAAGGEGFLGVVTMNTSGAPVPAIFRVEIVNGEGWPANVNNEGVVLDDFKWGRTRY